MASATIGSLRVNLGIDSAQFSTGLKQAESRLGKFGKLASFGMLKAAAAVAAFATAMKIAINEADALEETAQKIGMTTEELSKLRYAAGFSGISFDQMTTALGRLGKSIYEAGVGSKAMSANFAALGIASRNSDGSLRSTNDVLMDLADKFAVMPDGANKTAMAMKLLGKSGADMIPMLNAGSAGLKLLGDEAARAGVVISGDTAKAAGEFNDAVDRLAQGIKGQLLQAMAALAPAMARIARGAVVVSLNLQNLKAIAAEVWDRMGLMALGFAAKLNAIAAGIPGAWIVAFKKIVHAAATAFTAVPGSIGEKLISPLVDADKALAASKTEGEKQFEKDWENANFLINEATKPLKSIIQPLEAAEAALGAMGETAEVAAGGGGGGGGGGVSKLNQALEDLKSKSEQVFAETRTPMEEYAATIKELGVLLNTTVDGQTLINLDTYNRAVLEAKETLEQAGDTGENSFKQLNRSFQSTIADMLQGATTFRDAFSDIMAQIASALVTSGIARIFSNILNPAGGGILGGLGKIIGVERNALGTQFSRGGMSLVGERGPELVHLPRGSKVTPNSRLGGGGGLVYAPVIDARGADPAAITRLELLMRSQAADFERTFRDRTMAAVADPRYRGRS